MPVFNLGFLGRFKVQRMEDDNIDSSHLTIEDKESKYPADLRAEESVNQVTANPLPPRSGEFERIFSRPTLPSATTEQRRSSEFTQAPPPPYSLLPSINADPCQTRQSSRRNLQKDWKARETEWYNTVLAQDPSCRIMRLRRYIMETVALNVQADFRTLNIALYGYNRWGHDDSILSPPEREDLLDLGRYVQGLHEDFKLGKPIDQMDTQRYYFEIVKPYLELSHNGWPLFEVDLLVWYAESASSEVVRVPWFESGVPETEIVRGKTSTARETNDLLIQRMIRGFEFLTRTFSINEGVQSQLNSKRLD